MPRYYRNETLRLGHLSVFDHDRPDYTEFDYMNLGLPFIVVSFSSFNTKYISLGFILIDN